MKRPTVILRDCPDYDAARIERLAGEGLDLLGLRPFGRTLIKPNVVASGPRFPHAYTRPEFVEGVARALASRARPDLREIAVGERCGITMPTRYAFEKAGYYRMAERVPQLKLYHFDEVPQVEVPLYHPGRLRDSFFTPEPVAKADFFVNCPKLKAHPWTTVTFSLKNYIGIQDDRHRLIDHDHKLDEKIADLQYIVQPQFIAIDGIIAGEGRMLTPLPFDLRLMAMGDNQVAFDSVLCHAIGLDPLSVPHIRLAHERGFGPVDLDAIRITGDLTLDELKARARGFRVGLVRVEEYFKDSNLRAYAGRPPSDTTDYCWGGCPGALEEAIEILRLFDSDTDRKMPRTHVVFGAYDGQIDAKPGEKIVFLGDCASYQGSHGGAPLSIESLYVDRSKKNPHRAVAPDIFAKMAGVELEMFQKRNHDVLRIAGCPVSVSEQVLLLVKLGKLKNPYLDLGEALPFVSAYFSWRVHNLLRTAFGWQYQVPGGTERGAARPPQNLAPEGALTPLERATSGSGAS
ncbi:MAG: DUF362 domain-containing protein [Polyangiaceae bacterium]|jgi:uncharacterized protein (DUF362 family)|nr:DUF362 domain-containing protein [Polyangiaceae bacterium]